MRSHLWFMILVTVMNAPKAEGSKLVSCPALDRDYLMVSFKDGDVVFVDAAPTAEEAELAAALPELE